MAIMGAHISTFGALIMKMDLPRPVRVSLATVLALFALVRVNYGRYPQDDKSAGQTEKRPWMNTSLSPDERADLVVKEMTLDEKIDLAHGTGWGALIPGHPIFPGNNRSE